MDLKLLKETYAKMPRVFRFVFALIFLSYIWVGSSNEALGEGVAGSAPYLSPELLYSETWRVPWMRRVVPVHNFCDFGSLLVDALCCGEQRVKQGAGAYKVPRFRGHFEFMAMLRMMKNIGF